MPKEAGPREKALREMREAKYAERNRRDKGTYVFPLDTPVHLSRKAREELAARVAEAAKKPGKPRKAKK